MSLRIGLSLPQLGEHVDTVAVREFAVAAEELGFASLWVQEHLFYPEANESVYGGRHTTSVHPAYRSVFGATELMAFVAACTRTVSIGSSILVAGYHRPVELAQRLATLDVLSGGRLVAGLGAGWSDEEHAQMDVDPRTRGRRMSELVEAVRACWGPDPVQFDGDFFTIPRSAVRPKPVQTPHPPLLSGLRSAAGLTRTAALFDIWNPSSGTPEALLDQLDTMAGMRPEGMSPVRLFLRSYLQRPTDAVGSGGQGITGVENDIRTALVTGAEQLIVELNFWDEMRSSADWVAAPSRLAPLLEKADELSAQLATADAP
ncbi:TIGR03619 family F420-dependent LLM class oxidoreductase [Rhodococcus sp. BP-252]|uniref:LLM class F420-dependent oxidoreductase n=1 Tax=Rhodococcoides kyotonense TaxID=398843 RepID=A0A177YAP4_9NOCA|nr:MULTISPECIES: TIGR03619 family F420-dependent LLM class oxidoreductase [Rhodococcus]NIL78012.1 glucose-6-phosphate dehydrogenase [Rhodococcus sp. B10]MBY6411574.1 TIGR03619 family F420-dependent LLM class oxidoreductase [Rhodococcus sp. BP-320]MBY6417956.1 TIGR03619 family F420-dependent LLM class oxidoreductase [Rhodococcus sp. BP-321]MBY6422143.1 TIGR03619 family F420-dependent LLM class oxidoreductase [Rhodococcus sp. BP-324]MBY6427754.1 TIGR03619 family F420-dependent LLM class oxidored